MQQLEPLRAKGLQLPGLPDTTTTANRVYETNLRAILRYLKQVNKACKRQDPDSCSQVLTYRCVVKQLHDVDEWATKTLLSLLHEGLNGFTENALTPDQLREFLNSPTASPTASPFACDDHALSIADDIEVCSPASNMTAATSTIVVKDDQAVEALSHINPEKTDLSMRPTSETPKFPPADGITFNFDGSCREDTPDSSSYLYRFRFRCPSDPTSDGVVKNITSRYSLNTEQAIGYLTENLPLFRRVSAPVSSQDPSENCVLQLTGETLEQFVAGVEVEESKIENKKRWLLRLHSLESSCFLGRWPSPTKLPAFMQMHNLDWPVRMSGKWNLSPKSFSEREAIKDEVVGMLFAYDTVCDKLSHAEEGVKEHDHDDATNLNVVEDVVSEEHPSTTPTAQFDAGQDASNDTSAEDRSIEGLLDTSISLCDNPNPDHSDTSVREMDEASKNLSAESVFVDEDLAVNQNCHGIADGNDDLAETVIMPDETDLLEELDLPEDADVRQELAFVDEVDMSDSNRTLVEGHKDEEVGFPLVCKIAGEAKTMEELIAPGEITIPEVVERSEESDLEEELREAEKLELHCACDNLSHIFVWVKSGEFARESKAEERVYMSEELQCRCTHDNLSHIFVWLGSGAFEIDSSAQAKLPLLRESPEPENLDVAPVARDAENGDAQHTQIEQAATGGFALSNLTGIRVSADLENCDPSIQDREFASNTDKAAEGEILHDDDQTFFTHCSDGKVPSHDTIGDETEETEATDKVIAASEGLKISDINSKLEVQEALPLKIPTIILTLPDGTKADIETIPWMRRKRGKQAVDDPSRLAPPPCPKKALKREQSHEPRCVLLGCDRCAKLSLKESVAKAEKKQAVENSNKSADRTEKVAKSKSPAGNEEQAPKKSMEISAMEAETHSGTIPERQASDHVPASKKSERVYTANAEEESKDKLAAKHKEHTETNVEEFTEEPAATSIALIFTDDDESATQSVKPILTVPMVSATDDMASTYTPPKWSVTPILGSLALSALYLSAHCPVLSALAIVAGSISLKNKLSG